MWERSRRRVPRRRKIFHTHFVSSVANLKLSTSFEPHTEVAAVNRGERAPAIRSGAGLKAPASGS
jgi:hypothetical protein